MRIVLKRIVLYIGQERKPFVIIKLFALRIFFTQLYEGNLVVSREPIADTFKQGMWEVVGGSGDPVHIHRS